MPLDPELQPVIDLVNAVGGEPPEQAGVAAVRDGFELLCAGFGAGPEAVTVTGLMLAGRGGDVPARCYDPPGRTGPDPRRPGAIVFFHGGGFTIGSLDSHDALCRNLCERVGAVVVSVDYRLAPEHPFPAAVHDAVDALAAVVARADDLGVDRERIAVAGDSAGGNLATVVARHWRDRRAGEPDLVDLRLQVLLYPVCDLSHDPDRFPSLRENGEGLLLTAEVMRFFRDNYLGTTGADPTDPDVDPLDVADLAGLAPALVVTAELDPLRDEGEAYARALAAAGVGVTATRYDGAIHSFLQMGSVAAIARRALDQVVDALRTAVG